MDNVLSKYSNLAFVVLILTQRVLFETSAKVVMPYPHRQTTSNSCCSMARPIMEQQSPAAIKGLESNTCLNA